MLCVVVGDKIILNARTFTRGAAVLNSKERDCYRDRGREVDKDKDKDKGAGKEPLHQLLNKPHQLVAALLKLA